MISSRETGFRSEIDDISCKIHFPGLSYDDFDRNGNVSIWKIAKLMEGCRAIAFYGGYLNDIISLKNSLNVLIAQGFKVKPNAFKKYHSFPFSVTMNISNLGSSSLTFCSKMRNEKTKAVICTSEYKMVKINIETRRSFQIPQEIREKYQGLLGVHSAEYQTSFHSNVPELPLVTFHIPVFILHNDTDKNHHLNQGQFIRYCLDCAAMATSEGFYKYFLNDICLYQALEVNILYKREGFAGDLVHVHTWQDEVKPEKLHFIITKDKNSMVYTTITFSLQPTANL